jgi:hypothetical protein
VIESGLWSVKFPFAPRAIILTLLAGAALAVFAFLYQKKQSSDDHIKFLASDAHVVVGDVPLIVPFVALTGYISEGPSFSLNRENDRKQAKDRLAAFRKAASSAGTAPLVEKLQFGLSAFGFDDPEAMPGRICAQLSRDWSKSVCMDPWAPLQQAMPYDHNKVYFADNRNLAVFDNHNTVGDERVSDQLKAMKMITGEPSVVCDKLSSSKTQFCTAAVLIKQHLTAVWTVWNSNAETPAKRAAREGKAITALVLNGLGATENYPALLAVACKMKDPEAAEGVHQSPCENASVAGP